MRIARVNTDCRLHLTSENYPVSTEDTPKPAAWLMVNANLRLTPSVTLTPQTGWHSTWEARPLYDQATLDAAVAEERERCAKMADEYATWGGSNFYGWFKKLAAAIRA